MLVGGGELHDRWETLVARPRTAVARHPALHRDHAGDGRRGAARRGGAPRSRRAGRGPRPGRPQRGLRSPRPAPGVRARRPALARAAGAVHASRWRGGCTRSPASAGCAPLAESLGIEVECSHRALADAETCARVFCALFPRLCANAATVGEALGLLRPARPRRRRAGETFGGGAPRARRRRPDVAGLPEEPGVYVVRNAEGQPLYVGKSTAVRSRVRAHFAPSSPSTAWTLQAETVDCEATALRARGAGARAPADQAAAPAGQRGPQARRPLRLPALPPGHPVPGARGRAGAGGRATPSRSGRCAGAARRWSSRSSSTRSSACATAAVRCRGARGRPPTGRWAAACRRACSDLDPNLYRRRLDEALGRVRRPACGPGAARPRRRADAPRRRRAALRAGRVARAAGACAWRSCSPGSATP